MLTKVFKKWSLFSKKNNNIKNIIFYNINKKPYANLSPRVHNLSFTSILNTYKREKRPKTNPRRVFTTHTHKGKVVQLR